MVQEGRRSRPCLTKPHLPGADVKKLLDDVKDTTWFDWQGNPLHQDELQKQLPHRMFTPSAWTSERLEEYKCLLLDFPDIPETVKGQRQTMGLDAEGTEGHDIDDLYGIDGFAERFNLAGKSAVDVCLYLTQALATFPAVQHFPRVQLYACEAQLIPPPEADLAEDALQFPACTVAVGDFVMVEIPPGYSENSVDHYEHDAVTPHFLVAQVEELFVDAAGVPRFAGRWYFTRSETSLRWRHAPEPVKRFGRKSTFQYTPIGHNAEGHAMFRMQDQCAIGTLPEQVFPACPTDKGLWFDVPCCLPLATILKRVTTEFKPPELSLEDFQQQLEISKPDYWWQYEFGYHFISFTVPADHAERVFALHNGKMLEAGNRRQINVLEVYAGAGGTSFIANEDDDVSITTRWAVDLFDDAVVTFATNHPETSCYHMGVEEFMIMVIQFQHLWDNYHVEPAAARVNSFYGRVQRQGHAAAVDSKPSDAVEEAEVAAGPNKLPADASEVWKDMLPPRESVFDAKPGLLESLGQLHPLEHAGVLGKKVMPLRKYDRAQEDDRRREQRINEAAEKALRSQQRKSADAKRVAELAHADVAAEDDAEPSAPEKAASESAPEVRAGAPARQTAGVLPAATSLQEDAVKFKRFKISRAHEGRLPKQPQTNARRNDTHVPQQGRTAAARPQPVPCRSRLRAVHPVKRRNGVPISFDRPARVMPPRRQKRAASGADESCSESSSGESHDDDEESAAAYSEAAFSDGDDADPEVGSPQDALVDRNVRAWGDSGSGESSGGEGESDDDQQSGEGGMQHSSDEEEDGSSSDDEDGSSDVYSGEEAGSGTDGSSDAGASIASARLRKASQRAWASELRGTGVQRFRGAGRSGTSSDSGSGVDIVSSDAADDSACSDAAPGHASPSRRPEPARRASRPSPLRAASQPLLGSRGRRLSRQSDICMQAAREPGVPTTIPRVKLTRMAETGRSGDADHGGPGMDTATQAPQCRARPPQRPSRARISSEDLGDGAPAPEAEPVDDPVMPTRFARLKLKRAESPTQRRKSSSMSGARTKRRSVRTSSGEPFQAPAPPDAAAEQPQLCEPQIRRLRLSRCLSDPPAASDGEAAGCSGQAPAMAASNAAPAPRSSGADVPQEISAGGDPGSPMPVILSSDLAASAAPSIGTAAGTSARSADVASDGFPSAQACGPEDEVDTTDDDCVVLEDDGRESVSVATDDEGGTDSEVGSDLSEITLGADVPEEVMAIVDDVFETPKPLKVEYDDAGSKEQIEKIVDMRLVEVSDRQNMGQGQGQIRETMREGDYNLMFRVRFVGQPPSQDEWRTEADMGDSGAQALHKWVHHVRERLLLPIRGDCNLITGGPPCQSVSGNNRNALSDSILHDPRNRQLLVYVRLIEFLQPEFVLLEQVLDILLKENGVYVKTMTANLVRMGYQARTGTLITGAYGCPQGRARVIMLAAQSTEPLPAFPEPTHLVRQFNRTQGHDSVQCNVGFTCEESVMRAHDPVLVADAISDLPGVRNFHSSDVSLYQDLPETPYQVFMRRSPPPWCASAGERAEVGDSMVKPIISYLNDVWCKEIEREGLASIGRNSGVVVGGTKSSDLCRASLPTSARAHVLEALSDLLARNPPPPPTPTAASDGQASSDASGAAVGASGSDADAASDVRASSDSGSRSFAAVPRDADAGSDAGAASGVDTESDAPSGSNPSAEVGTDPASAAVAAEHSDAVRVASGGSDAAAPSSVEPTTSSSASDDDCIMAEPAAPHGKEPLQDGVASHLRRQPAETLEEFRARNADDRRRNVLRRTFALVAKHQRVELRTTLEKRLEAAKAAAAGRASAVSQGVFCDAATDDDTASDSDCSDATCSQLNDDAAAGEVANGVLWGRARGELPLDKEAADQGGEEGNGDAVFAGAAQRMQRHVQLSDLESLADASWRLAAGKHPKLSEVEAKDLVAERIPLSVAVAPSSYDIFPEAQESMSGSSSDSDSDGSASGDDDTTALGDTSDGSTECPGSDQASDDVSSQDDTDCSHDSDDSEGEGEGEFALPGESAGGLMPAHRPAVALDPNRDLLASKSSGGLSEVRAEAAMSVREALRAGKSVTEDIPDYSDEEELEEELNLRHRTTAHGTTLCTQSLGSPAVAKRPPPVDDDPAASHGDSSCKRMRGAGADMPESSCAAESQEDVSCDNIQPDPTGCTSPQQPAPRLVGQAALPLTELRGADSDGDAPVTVAPTSSNTSVAAVATTHPMPQHPPQKPLHPRQSAMLARATVPGSAPGTLSAAAQTSAVEADSDASSDCGLAEDDACGVLSSDACLEAMPDGDAETSERRCAVSSRPRASAELMQDHNDLTNEGLPSNQGGEQGVKSDGPGTSNPDAYRCSTSARDAGADAEDPGHLSSAEVDALLEPCMRMYGFPDAVAWILDDDDGAEAIAVAAAELPPIKSAHAHGQAPRRAPDGKRAGGTGLSSAAKAAWVEYGLDVLAEYEVEAEEWQAERARTRWRRALAEPPSDDWDRKVIAEAVGSLLDEKSRVLYVMMYIITRHQRYLQAGLEQLAAVAEYSVSLTGPNSKQFDWELPKQGEAPFVPTRPMSEPHVDGQHDAVTKPRATRFRDHAVLSYFRHTKPGQRLQLIDLGRKRPGLQLEQLQNWQPTGRPMRGWQLAAAEEAFSGAAQVVRAHLPHACNIEDEMRMAAVPRYDSRYLHLLNYNFRDWPGVTANPDGSQCCGHFHAYVKRENKELFSGCPSYRDRASVQLPGLYTMPGNTRTHDSRVDSNLKGSVTVVTQTPSCGSRTMILSTGRLLCPRYAATFKVGFASGHQGCFGRVSPLSLMPTVVTRPEPHNLCIVHPTQDRVLTPRENARFQGFPDYYYIVATGSLVKGESAVSDLEAIAPNKPFPLQVQAAMKEEHEQCLVGDQQAFRTYSSRFRIFNANRYLQTGNAVSPVLSAAIGRSISAACAGKSHVHNPVQAVPDPEYDAAIAASRAHGLLSTYQELVLMAEAFQRQQAVGHELLAHAGPSQRGPADFRTPAMERMEAVGQAREALDVAMRNGMAPVGSEAYSQLCRAADPSLQADDVAYPSVAISGSKRKKKGIALDVIEDHADKLLTKSLQHSQIAADAGAHGGRHAIHDPDCGDDLGERFSDAESDEETAHAAPTTAPFPTEGHAAREAAGSPDSGDCVAMSEHDNAAQENVPPAISGSQKPGDCLARVEERVRNTCISGVCPDVLLVERGDTAAVERLTDPSLRQGYCGSRPASTPERAAVEVRNMVSLQPAAAGCALRHAPPPTVRSAAACSSQLREGSVDMPATCLGRRSMYTLRRPRPMLARLSAAQAQRAHTVLQRSIPADVLHQLMADDPGDAAEGRRRLHACVLEDGQQHSGP